MFLFINVFVNLILNGCSVSKETTDVTVTSYRESIIRLALLHEFVYEFRGNNTCIIQDRAALLCDLHTGSSRLMRISLLRISLVWFFKTITKIWLMRFYGLFVLLLRT